MTYNQTHYKYHEFGCVRHLIDASTGSFYSEKGLPVESMCGGEVVRGERGQFCNAVYAWPWASTVRWMKERKDTFCPDCLDVAEPQAAIKIIGGVTKEL
mgnify:CR=1